MSNNLYGSSLFKDGNDKGQKGHFFSMIDTPINKLLVVLESFRKEDALIEAGNDMASNVEESSPMNSIQK